MKLDKSLPSLADRGPTGVYRKREARVEQRRCLVSCTITQCFNRISGPLAQAHVFLSHKAVEELSHLTAQADAS
jgi:hypothetical protein